MALSQDWHCRSCDPVIREWSFFIPPDKSVTMPKNSEAKRRARSNFSRHAARTGRGRGRASRSCSCRRSMCRSPTTGTSSIRSPSNLPKKPTSPRRHPRHLIRTAEVVRVLWPAPPPPLALLLACPPASRLPAVSLMAAIARIRDEAPLTVQAFASALGVHRPKLPHIRASPTNDYRCKLKNGVGRKKIHPAGRTTFLARRGRKSSGRRTTFNPPLLHDFQSAAGKYHHVRLHAGWRRLQEPDFTLHFLPPYSPELNPIERVWKLLRRLWLHNRFFPSLHELTEVVDVQFEVWKRPNPVLKRLCSL